MGQPQNRGSPAHVFLHQIHAGRGFDVQPARVKANALADQGQLGPSLAPAHLHDARRAGRGAAYSVDHGEVLRQQVVAPDHGRGRPKALGKGCKGGLKLGWPHVRGGRVDQIAGEKLCLCHGQKAGAIGAFGQAQQGRVGFLRGTVAVESVRVQQPCQNRFIPQCGCERPVQRPIARRQACHGLGDAKAQAGAGLGRAQASDG